MFLPICCALRLWRQMCEYVCVQSDRTRCIFVTQCVSVWIDRVITFPPACTTDPRQGLLLSQSEAGQLSPHTHSPARTHTHSPNDEFKLWSCQHENTQQRGDRTVKHRGKHALQGRCSTLVSVSSSYQEALRWGEGEKWIRSDKMCVHDEDWRES